MRINKIFLVLLTVIFGSVCIVSAQSDSSMKPSLITGEVVSIDPGKIVLNTKDGEVTASISDKTEFKRVPPENPVLKAAVAAAITDIGAGDKLVVTGIFGADKKTLPARSVYLMTKSDISQRHAKEAEEWRTRGITGRVASVNPQTKQVVVEMRGLAGSTNVTLTPKDNATFLRYAADSVKFEEAKPSNVGEIKPGDMLRALGDRGADGTTFTAERVITGAFQTVAGTVKSVDAAKGEVVITNLQTKKDVTIAISPTSVMKKFPAEMATRMAGFQGGGVRPPGQGGGASPAPSGGQQAGAGPGRGFGTRGAGGIDEMLDRFPSITPADLKAGDMIAVSSTKNGNLERINAIKLLAGVEPFIRAAQASGASAGGQRGQGDFNIPGLEGFGNP
jgi:ribosomal protein L24